MKALEVLVKSTSVFLALIGMRWLGLSPCEKVMQLEFPDPANLEFSRLLKLRTSMHRNQDNMVCQGSIIRPFDF